MRRTVPPSAEIEQQIDALLAVGVGENPREALSELAKLGARLIIQRAVEDEFDAWLGRARYERRPEYQRGLRNGFRPRRVQTAEGELSVKVPQVREAAEPFVSRLFPRRSWRRLTWTAPRARPSRTATRCRASTGHERTRRSPSPAAARCAAASSRAGTAWTRTARPPREPAESRPKARPRRSAACAGKSRCAGRSHSCAARAGNRAGAHSAPSPATRRTHPRPRAG